MEERLFGRSGGVVVVGRRSLRLLAGGTLIREAHRATVEEEIRQVEPVVSWS